MDAQGSPCVGAVRVTGELPGFEIFLFKPKPIFLRTSLLCLGIFR